VLMIDVSQKIACTGGSLHGFATNVGASSDNVKASTVKAFMVSSVFSKNKDVVALEPVNNSFLHKSVIKVLKMIGSVDYRENSIVSAFISVQCGPHYNAVWVMVLQQRSSAHTQ